MHTILPPQPGPSSSKAIQGPAEQSWTNPIADKASRSAAEAIAKNPLHNPINPHSLGTTPMIVPGTDKGVK